MSFKVGIVGLPNVGKSTLFKALTKKAVTIANYPFATIDPNVGVVAVKDARLDELARVSASEKIVPTSVEFVDIAGLVKDAHKGEGLGNKFLAHIREVDAIAEVVRAFSDPEIIHVAGGADPARDAEIINYELMYADLESVERRRESVLRQMKGATGGNLKVSATTIGLLDRVQDALKVGRLARTVERTADEQLLIRDLNLLTDKPLLYVMNVDEAGLRDGTWKGALPSEYNPQVPLNAKIEAELAELSVEDAAEYVKALGIPESGLDHLIRSAYKALGLITFFTSGPKESRAWTVVKGVKAPQAAGVIHSDFEKAFIRAEVFNWKEFVSAGGEAPAKEKGHLRIEGKDYEIKDGDVCHFRVGV